MNRILEVDEKRAFALVEPGVSYFDLYKYIRDRDFKLMLDVPDPGWGSPMGNSLDHGAGYTLAAFRDHFSSHCGMEVVTPDGDMIRTGMGAVPNSDSWQDSRYGAGPNVDGLFARVPGWVALRKVRETSGSWFGNCVSQKSYSKHSRGGKRSLVGMTTAEPLLLDIIRFILKDELMPKRCQNGKLEIRRDLARPYYFVRTSVVRIDKVTESGRDRRIGANWGRNQHQERAPAPRRSPGGGQGDSLRSRRSGLNLLRS